MYRVCLENKRIEKNWEVFQTSQDWWQRENIVIKYAIIKQIILV